MDASCLIAVGTTFMNAGFGLYLAGKLVDFVDRLMAPKIVPILIRPFPVPSLPIISPLEVDEDKKEKDEPKTFLFKKVT
jgi:hypothetical protein